MADQTISVGNCPGCNHYPTQFVKVPECEDYVVHLPAPDHCEQRSAQDRIRELENKWDHYQELVRAHGFNGITHLLSEYRKLADAPHGELEVMGDIRIEEGEDHLQPYDKALVITFENPEMIRRAIRDGVCTFSFKE